MPPINRYFVGRSSKRLCLRDPVSGKAAKEVRWGDFLRVIEDRGKDWLVRWGKASYLFSKANTVQERPLEIVFVDVGQGDGCLVVSPEHGEDERVFIVDAGEGDNMKRFLDWRFGRASGASMAFHAAVVTHSDQDHYGGLLSVFGVKRFSFANLFHNGIVERSGAKDFGKVSADGYLEDIVVSDMQARDVIAAAGKSGKYRKVLAKAIQQSPEIKINMLSNQHGVLHQGRRYMPGFAPGDVGDVKIEVLGPVVERKGQKVRLRGFADKIGGEVLDEGKTKNGHSVLLRLVMHDFSLLFGGDLNSPAEDFLLRHYGELNDGDSLGKAVAKARERFQCTVMKCCHHGSEDVTDEFLRAVNPAAYVVSSGDNESHMHPRPQLLGRLGKNGRGGAPAILSTELQRSGLEQNNARLVDELRKIQESIATSSDPEETKKLIAKQEATLKLLARRPVQVYGAINLRTDGRFLEVSIMKESASETSRWFKMTYELGGPAGIRETED